MLRGVAVRPGPPSRLVRGIVRTLRDRHDALVVAGADRSEWHRLQFDAVRALVDGERAFVELHGQILAALRRDRPLYTRLRLESLHLNGEIDALRELVRATEKCLILSESAG